ncbi:MAG: CoA-binding protein [Candidatus Aminicenantes bacterium]|nr:CoA-binding protein [Candidatus Aminicenantes bacterium]
MNKLNFIFYPRSIAVIGASREPGSVGQSLLANIIGNRIQGIVYPVNPKAKGILGIKSYPTVTEIPDVVDLAIIIVPSRYVPSVLDECGQKGVKGAIIISAGFKEIGGAGIELEQEIEKIIENYNISLLGPNCLGIINTDPKSCLNATFGMQFPKQGNISFVSQSGALCVAVLEYAKEANVGFAKFISMGNKADINENDLLLYLKEDHKTDVILMYLEDLVNGREFMRIAREITSDASNPKPIIALKAGSTVLGARAASSHTGSLAGSDKVYDAVFEQCGVLRVETLEELFDYVRAFSSQPLPAGRNVAIVTNSGGPGILATDSCIHYGLNVTSLSSNTVQALKKALPPTASFNNPVDLIGDAHHDRYEVSLKHVLKDKKVHSSIVILTPTAFTDVEKIATSIVNTANAHKKPVLACFLGVYDVSKGIEILEENGIPSYRFPESAARVLSEMTNYTWWLNRPQTGIRKFKVNKIKAKKIIESVQKQGRHFLSEQEAYQVLEAYKFPVIKSILAKDEKGAMEKASRLGFPVAMKIVSPDILHKFDYGGVKLNLKNQSEVRQAYREILRNVRAREPKARITGILVETMARAGKEVILGMNRDPQFGPILMFGLGGIYVEALEDVAFRLAPIRELTASMMIKRTKTHKILDGFRGGPVYDIPAIEESLKRLSQLVSDFELIKELDINPLIVHEKGKGCTIVDARIILD